MHIALRQKQQAQQIYNMHPCIKTLPVARRLSSVIVRVGTQGVMILQCRYEGRASLTDPGLVNITCMAAIQRQSDLVFAPR